MSSVWNVLRLLRASARRAAGAEAGWPSARWLERAVRESRGRARGPSPSSPAAARARGASATITASKRLVQPPLRRGAGRVVAPAAGCRAPSARAVRARVRSTAAPGRRSDRGGSSSPSRGWTVSHWKWTTSAARRGGGSGACRERARGKLEPPAALAGPDASRRPGRGLSAARSRRCGDGPCANRPREQLDLGAGRASRDTAHGRRAACRPMGRRRGRGTGNGQ